MKTLNRVHLNGLRAVEAVARLGSLASAAAELGVTVGAVSQQVIRTEKALGRTIFARTATGLEVNGFGRVFTSHLHTGFQNLMAAVALADERNRNRLTVSVAPVFASKFLVPRLQSFNRQYPELQLRIDASVGLVDLDRSDVDVAIRVGPGGWEGVALTRIIGQTIFPVCSPALAARLKGVGDLSSLPIIRDANAPDLWREWLDGIESLDVRLGDGPVFSDASLCLDAAIAGQGVMMAWPTLAADGLADGRLTMPFPRKVATPNSYWFVTSQNHRPPRKVEDFRRWLTAEILGSLQRVPGLAETVV